MASSLVNTSSSQTTKFFSAASLGRAYHACKCMKWGVTAFIKTFWSLVRLCTTHSYHLKNDWPMPEFATIFASNI